MHARTLEAKKTVAHKLVAQKTVAQKTVAQKKLVSDKVVKTALVKAVKAPAKKLAPMVAAAPVAKIVPMAAKKLDPKAVAKPVAAVLAPVVAAPVVGTFKVGDHAVYPARGVAQIVSIEEKDIAGKRQAFYVLRLLDTDHKIMVPVANAASIGLRKPINEGDIRRIFQILKVKDVPIDTQTWNRRQRAFVEKLSTGSVFEVAEVMRDLERVKDVKDALSFSERQMLERARQLLIKEIAVSRNKSDETVRTQIDALFAAASRAAKSN